MAWDKTKAGAGWAGRGLGEGWHRTATWGLYAWDVARRRLKNPIQTVKDQISGTGVLEDLSGFEAIVIRGGELKRDGAYCGREAECVTGVPAAPGDLTASTTGHTIRFEDTNPFPRLVAHEMQHVYDIENIGGLPFYATYYAQMPFTGYSDIS